MFLKTALKQQEKKTSWK